MSRLLQGTAAITLAAVLVGPLCAADDKPTDKPPVKSAEVKAVFHDGSTIHKAVLQDSVEIQTKYGKLTIPAADIRRIEFGLHTDGDAGKKVEELVKALGSEDFAQREAASKDLVKLGAVAVVALEQAVKSPDKEIAMRAKAALDRIRESVPEDRLHLKAEDVVTTADCVFTGKISGTVLKAQTENFGELQFKMAQLAMIQSAADVEKKPGMPGIGTGAFPGGNPPMGFGPRGVVPPGGGFNPNGPFPGGPPGGGPGVPMIPGGAAELAPPVLPPKPAPEK